MRRAALPCGPLARGRCAVANIIYTIVVVLLFVWLVSAVAHIGVNVSGLLLVVAVILVLFNIIVGRRNA